ncbi:MAG: hypothetical protein GX058_10025 [Firmicutes bacterium]|nr:hypothetical protein [Bacillota bacterium]
MRLSEGAGKYRVEAALHATAEGYILHLLGGEKPHVGAVVIAQPRPSLTGDGSISCTTSSLPLLGHKDDLVAKPVAEAIAKATGQTVVAIAGIHIENATAAELDELQRNVEVLTAKLLRELEG